jgi:hypothetical protein
MSGIANIFSTIDSAKRVLKDRLSGGVVADVQKTLGRASEDAAAFRETQRAGGAAAEAAMLSAAMNVMPGGMIAHAADVIPFNLFNGLRKTLATPGVDKYKVAENSNVFYMPHDRELRTVISDLAARLKIDPAVPIPAGMKVSDALDHPELFKYYPELADMPLAPLAKESMSRGSLYPKTNNEIGTIALRPTSSGEDMTSVLLHELQHSLDMSRGTQAGGSPSQFLLNRRDLNTATRNARTAFENSLVNNTATDATAALARDANTLIRTGNAAGQEYARIPGEVSARITQEMRKNKQDEALDVLKYLNKPGFELDVTPVTTKFDDSPAIQQLIKQYLNPTKP